jgi:hypothetical protein
VADAERRLAAGSLRLSDLPGELNQVGAHVRDLSRRFPDFEELTQFRRLPFSPEFKQFLKHTDRPGAHVHASSYSRGKHVNGTTNAMRQSNSAGGGGGQYFAELSDGTRVTDSVIEGWERQAIERARRGHGRLEARGRGQYHMYVDMDFDVGFANGKPTNLLRVEWTAGGAVHSHPRPPADL